MMARMKIRAHHHLALPLTVLLLTTALTSAAQKQSPSDQLAGARALYYTPTTQGLKSFHCDLLFDWKDMLTRFSGTEIQDDNPFLKYLRSAHLSVTDDLKGTGQLEWANTEAPPVGKEEPAAKMEGGMKQMISGFYTSWNAYMNGSMVPVPDVTTTVTAMADGLRLHATTPSNDVTEFFDKNLLLSEAHIVQPERDVRAYPTFIDTPDGRLLSAIRTVYQQPPTAPPAELTMSVTYAPVQTFRLPASLEINMQNVGIFVFKFSGCSVQTANKAAGKL
jgi:hypothetical protein